MRDESAETPEFSSRVDLGGSRSVHAEERADDCRLVAAKAERGDATRRPADRITCQIPTGIVCGAVLCEVIGKAIGLDRPAQARYGKIETDRPPCGDVEPVLRDESLDPVPNEFVGNGRLPVRLGRSAVGSCGKHSEEGACPWTPRRIERLRH